MIELKEISKIYKTKKGVKTQALDHLSFSLPEKGLFFILGKSGSGKSTLLNIIGGLDKYDQGELIVSGKNTKKFKSRDFDYYRNTYIGFIFQEFNLLEEYNVYDNILLSIKLQKEKIDLAKVDELLTRVGISGLGKRKINELSGGQKQRVAIARALIKNPEIILADEPTGSLDAETGKQIFSLLKEISRDKLVIIVSHDMDSATTYADGILEIQDGKIISNTIPTEEKNTQIFKSKKSKLPFLSSLKFAFLNLGMKKLKLFFTILLVFMSLTFFGISMILSEFHIEHSHAKTMVNTKEETVVIQKGFYNAYNDTWSNNQDNIYLTLEDISNIHKLTDINSVFQYRLNENNNDIGFDIDFRSSYNPKTTPTYYLILNSTLNFIEADSSFLNQEIIGTYPTNYDEVMIHSYLADCIMYYGILPYYENSNIYKKEYYKPDSYEELVNSNIYLKLGSTKVKISGIILDNTREFENLKNLTSDQVLSDEMWMGLPTDHHNYYKFSQMIFKYARDIYVMKGFIDHIELNPNTVIDDNIYRGVIAYNNHDYSLGNRYQFLDKKISVLDGDKVYSLDQLNKNEIIINETVLDKISANNYSKLKEQYIQNYNDKVKELENENKIIEQENQQLLSEYNQKLEQSIESEFPTLKELKKIPYKSESELMEEFAKNYIKENQIINSIVNLKFYNNQTNETFNYDNIVIKGIQFTDEDVVYMADNVAEDLMQDNHNIKAVVLKSNDLKKLTQLFTSFPNANSKYYSETIYSNTIYQISETLENISVFAFYASVVFGIFAFILLTNFIVNSIYYSKKTIGILRGLGARKMDVFKIFFNEGLLIGIFSTVISLIFLFIMVCFMNYYISDHLFFEIELIEFTVKNILIIVGSVITIIFLSSLLTVGKIAKMKPIDAILNK